MNKAYRMHKSLLFTELFYNNLIANGTIQLGFNQGNQNDANLLITWLKYVITALDSIQHNNVNTHTQHAILQ